MRARESSLTHSLARSPRLLFYVRALSIVVDVMRCARAQAAAADDRCGRCCRWTLPCVVGGGAVPLPCPSAVWPHRQLSAATVPGIPLGSRSFSRRTRGQAGAGGETTTTTTSTAAVASTTPSNAKPLDRRRSRRAGTLPRPPLAAAYPTPTHGPYVLVTRDRVPTTAPGIVITATRCY